MQSRFQVVHAKLHNIFVVEFHSVVARQIDLIGKRAQNLLEKRVDGAYVEIGVIFEHLAFGNPRTLADVILRCP